MRGRTLTRRGAYPQHSAGPMYAPVVQGLKYGWICLILWFELGTFISSVNNCAWPDPSLPLAGTSGVAHDQGRRTDVTHVLLIADAQIPDQRSYPNLNWFLSKLAEIFIDLNIRKSWRVTYRKTNPDVIIHLGDMMDGGRDERTAAEWDDIFYRRWEKMFRKDARVPTYYIPGNHDTGLSQSPVAQASARRRFTHFGLLNQKLQIGNHTFVLIDAPRLAEEDVVASNLWHGLHSEEYSPPADGTVSFLRHITKDFEPHQPVILLSHIPLFRPDNVSCGPLRESRRGIRTGFGLGYQNLLSAGASVYLLDELHPTLVFSGDDHDYCDYRHANGVREVTVKSFSMAMGVRRPGFQLLSLYNPLDAYSSPTFNASLPTYADQPCLLPDQYKIYLAIYIPCIVLSLFFLLLLNVARVISSTIPDARMRSMSGIRRRSGRNQNKVLSSILGDIEGGPPPLPFSRSDSHSSSPEYDQTRRRSPDTSLHDLPLFSPHLSSSSSPSNRPLSGGSSSRGALHILASKPLRLRRAATSFLSSSSSSALRGGMPKFTSVRRGLLRQYVNDVIQVGVPPLVVFLAISLWMFSDYS